MMNKKLDGQWELLTINSEKLDTNYSKFITFSENKEGERVVYSETINEITTTKSGNYALIKTGAISIAFPNSNFGSGYETETYDFVSTSKTDLVITQTSPGNKLYTFKKI